MHQITTDEEVSAHRIFNYVDSLIGGYYGQQTQAQVREFVSLNRWIMFPVKGITSLREGAEMPVPNCFIWFPDEEIRDNEAGIPKMGHMGLTYHNSGAMAAFHHHLQHKSKGLKAVLDDFGSKWSIEIQHKTKTDCKDSSPHYKTYRAFKSGRSMDTMDLSTAFFHSDKSLLEKGDIYPETGTPVIWSVSIFVVTKPVSILTFDQDVKKVFKAFHRLNTL